MYVNPDLDKPIFIQIAEQLEDSIFTGTFPEEKRRGLGMYVREGAVERIRRKRQGQFFSQYVASMVREAVKLEMSKEELMRLIERGYEDECNPDQ